MPNDVYNFLKENDLTQKSESDFVSEYSDPDKAKDLHGFFKENNLTQKDYDSFYGEYLKKKDGSEPTGGEQASTLDGETPKGFRTITEFPSVEYTEEKFEINDKKDEAIQQKAIQEREAVRKTKIDAYSELVADVFPKIDAQAQEIEDDRELLKQERTEKLQYLNTINYKEFEPSVQEFGIRADELDKREQYLTDAKDLITKAQKHLDTADDGIFKSMVKSPLAKDFFTLGISEITRGSDILTLVKKIDSGEELSKDEEMALYALGVEQMVEGNIEKDFTSIVGSGLAETIPFMVQFALSRGTTTAAKQATIKGIENMIGKMGTNKLKQLAIKGAGAITSAAVRTPALTDFYVKTIGKQTGQMEPVNENGNLTFRPIEETQKDAGEAVKEAFLETFITSFVEEGGSSVKGVAKTLKGKIPKTPMTANIGKETVNNIKTAVKFDGFVGELGEEVAEAYLQQGVQEGEWTKIPYTTEEFMATALSVGIISGSFSALDFATKGATSERRVTLEGFNKVRQNVTEKTQVDLDKILKGDNPKNNAEQLDVYVKQRISEGANASDIRNIVDYVSYKSKLKAESETITLIEEGKETIEEQEAAVEVKTPVKEDKEPKTGLDVEPKIKEDAKKENLQQDEQNKNAKSKDPQEGVAKEAVEPLEGEPIAEETKEEPKQEQPKKEAPVEGEPIKPIVEPIEPVANETKDEFKETPIGMTNRYVEASRIARGKDKTVKAARQSNEELFKGVEVKIDNGEIEPREAVVRLSQQDKPHASDENQAIWLVDRARIVSERRMAKNELKEAQEINDFQGELDATMRLAELELEQDQSDIASAKMGTEWGRFGQFRQRALKEDYSFEEIIREAKEISNDNLTTEQEKKFQELTDKYEELEQEKIKIEEEFEVNKKAAGELFEQERERIEKELIEGIRKEASKPPKNIKKKGKEIATKIRAAKLKNQNFTFSTVVPPQIIDGAMEVVATSIEVSANVAQAISDGIKHIKKSDWYKKLTSEDKKKFEARFKEHVNFTIAEDGDLDAEYDALIQDLIDKADGEYHDGLAPELSKLTKNRVKAGLGTIGDIVETLHESVKDEIPGITERNIRDGISGYGKFKKLSKDEINKRIREIKRQGKLDSSLEDVKDDKLPLRSGVQRDKKSQEIRDKESELAREIQERGLVPEPTEQDKETAWGSAKDAYKRRLENAIEDVNKEIETKERRKKAKKGKKYNDPDIIKLQSELKTLQDLRDNIFKIPTKTTEQKRTDAAVRAHKKAIDDINNAIYHLALGSIPPNLEPAVKSKDGKDKFGFKKEKGEPISNEEIDNLKQLRAALDEQMNEMMPEAIKKEALLDKYRKSREKELNRLETKRKNKDYAPKPKREKPIGDKESIRINREIQEVKEKIDAEKEEIRRLNRTGLEKILDGTFEGWNIPKMLIASVDMSATFIQGAMVAGGNPKVFASSFKDMFNQTFSEKNHKNWLRDLKGKDVYMEMKENGLYIIEPTAKLSEKAEPFMSNLIEKIPVWNAPVKVKGKTVLPGLQLISGSERAYVGFLNSARVGMYLDFKHQIEQEGLSESEKQAELKSYANIINNMTGRGGLGRLESISQLLNMAFFSPRMIAGRLNMFNPLFWAKMTPKARKEAVKTTLGFLGVRMATLTMLGLAFGGDEDDDFSIEVDPRSPDFGKIKQGNARLDIWGGFLPVIRAITQLTTGEAKNPKTGEIQKLRNDNFMGKTRKQVIGNFFRYKMSPSAALLYGIVDDFRTPMGDPITLKDATLDRVIPLYLQDIKEIMEEESASAAVLAGVPALFGLGVQYYGSEKQNIEGRIVTTERLIRRAERDYKEARKDRDYDKSDELMDKIEDLKDKKLDLDDELRDVR